MQLGGISNCLWDRGAAGCVKYSINVPSNKKNKKNYYGYASIHNAYRYFDFAIRPFDSNALKSVAGIS